MFDNWFANKCTALIASNGRALTGDALIAAETALANAKKQDLKIWSNHEGFVFVKQKSLFASAHPLIDKLGNHVRVCGRMVKMKAKFCSRCGSQAPNSWWRCGGCGQHIGMESQSCPHCGRAQNPTIRLDIADGIWQKNENIFAERFEIADILPLIPNGMNIQESQMGILLNGGAVSNVLIPGSYSKEKLDCTIQEDQSNLFSLVMVDYSEFVVPVCINKIRSSDDMVCEAHITPVLRFNPEHADSFMSNLMGSSLYLHNENITSALAYDEIAYCILQNIDACVRDFCNTTTIENIFKSPDFKSKLENHIAQALERNLQSIGIKFLRLNAVEFESETFEKFRQMSGNIAQKQQENQFIIQANEMANDAVKKEAASEFNMDDYMKQLAHENSIRDKMRQHESEKFDKDWERTNEKEALSHENNLDDLQQTRQLDRDRIDAIFEQEILDLQKQHELARKLSEQKNALDEAKIKADMAKIQIDIEKDKTVAEQEAAEKWLDLKMKKQTFNQEQKINLLQAVNGVNLQTLIAIEDDQTKRDDLLKLYQQQLQSQMTPELLLAAAAARGNMAAIEAMSKLSQDKLDAIATSKKENKEIFESMLQMNERMFNQTVENMAKSSAETPTKISNIIK